MTKFSLTSGRSIDGIVTKEDLDHRRDPDADGIADRPEDGDRRTRTERGISDAGRPFANAKPRSGARF